MVQHQDDGVRASDRTKTNASQKVLVRNIISSLDLSELDFSVYKGIST